MYQPTSQSHFKTNPIVLTVTKPSNNATDLQLRIPDYCTNLLTLDIDLSAFKKTHTIKAYVNFLSKLHAADDRNTYLECHPQIIFLANRKKDR